MKPLSAKSLALYYSPYCPFCHRVLDALQALDHTPDLSAGKAGTITLKNTASDTAAAKELLAGGGKRTVPCLAITQDDDTQWLYESLDIIAFLKTHLSA